MKPLLVLIDLQHDYLEGGAIQPSAARVIDRSAWLLRRCRDCGVPVAHVWTTVSRDADNRMTHWKHAGRWRCEAGTRGHQPPFSLTPRNGEAIVHKSGFSGFTSGELQDFIRLNAIDTVIVAGVNTHACVRQTVLDAYQSGLDVCVADDAVGSDDPVHAAITRRYLEARVVRFASCEAIANALGNGGIASIADSDGARAREAVSCAAGAAAAWRATTPELRATCVRRLADALASKADPLALLIAEVLGKPVRFSRMEVFRTVEMLGVLASRFERVQDQAVSSSCTLRRRPHGVVAAITPWNNPIYIPLGKIVPSILCGNVVAWKPAPEACAVSHHVIACIRESGLPTGVVSLLEGGRREATLVMSDERVNAVTITGSSDAGYSAQEICARRRIPLQAELGGNNAAIVWSDAHLSRAARSIAAGAFDMAGQRCTANRRVIVHSDCRERLLRELERETAALQWGDPRDDMTRIGPLVSTAHRDRVASTVERAVAIYGPALLPSGANSPAQVNDDRHRQSRLAWHPPTIICCDDPTNDIVQEETFGPILVVQTADHFDHALRLCNDVRQGLAAAIFSESREIQEQFLNEAHAGLLKVNQSTADAAVDTPFGGWKHSGIGPPEHGQFDLEFHTRPQSVYSDMHGAASQSELNS